MGIIIPIVIHGIYDTFAFMDSVATTVALLVFVAIMYFVAIKYVNKFSKDDWKSGFYTIPLSRDY